MKTKVLIALILLPGFTACSPVGRRVIRSVVPAVTEEQRIVFEEAKRALGEVDEFCRLAREGQLGLPLPVTVGGTIGDGSNGLYGGLNIAAIKDGQGNVFVLGEGPGASVGLIENWQGNVFLCAASVGRIHNVTGNVFVIHGNAGAVDGLAGTLFVRSGHITGPITNQQGFAIEETPDGHMYLHSNGQYVRLY